MGIGGADVRMDRWGPLSESEVRGLWTGSRHSHCEVCLVSLKEHRAASVTART